MPWCWKNQNSKDVLEDILLTAIDSWHTALGWKAGISFLMHCKEFCAGIPAENTVLNIEFCPGKISGTLGLYTTRNNGHRLCYDPAVVPQMPGDSRWQDRTGPAWDKVVGVMVYELGTIFPSRHNPRRSNTNTGHVLGLMHEHQRPDAATNITIHYDRIEGYDDVVRFLEFLKDSDIREWPAGLGRVATIEEVCSIELLAFHFQPVSFNAFMPMTEFPSWTSPNPIDRDSIMLYPSDMHDGIIIWHDAGSEVESPITFNKVPSAGNVEGVKMIYPDVSDRPSPPAPTRSSPPPPVPSKPSILKGKPVILDYSSLRADTYKTSSPTNDLIGEDFGTG